MIPPDALPPQPDWINRKFANIERRLEELNRRAQVVPPPVIPPLPAWIDQPTLTSAPASTEPRSSYPDGVSVWTASTGGGWPTNGILIVHNYSTAGRSTQRLTTASTGATTAPNVYTRHWGSGSTWTPWTELDSTRRAVSLEVTTSVAVTGTTFAETDTLARLGFTATRSQLAVVTMGMRVTSNTVGGDCWMSCKVHNTTDNVELLDYSDHRVAKTVQVGSSNEQVNERSFLLTGLEDGKSYAVRPGYRVESGTTGTWHTRWVIIQPSP